ncbi:BBIP1 protein, partial [Oxylabes madagascariensis]|nr:BBIP1 protein [Oxylabes madagascariensis]
MPEGTGALREVLPKQGTGGERRAAPPARPAARSRPLSPFAGQLSVEDTAAMVLCKPKILPLKSVSLEKLEKLQRAALEAAQAPEAAPPPSAGPAPPRE